MDKSIGTMIRAINRAGDKLQAEAWKARSCRRCLRPLGDGGSHDGKVHDHCRGWSHNTTFKRTK